MRKLETKSSYELLDALYVAIAPGSPMRNDPTRKAHINNLYKELAKRGYAWAADVTERAEA